MLRRTLESRGERLIRTEHAIAVERTEREVAQQAAVAKSELLSNMSHEIRTPLNAVVAMNDMLLETTLDATQRDMAETVHASSEHLLVIINDILDLSRFESAQMKLEIVPFDPVTAVENALELVASQAHAKRLFVGHAIPADIPRTVLGDATRVTQILVNFLNNAVKFTEQGSVHVTMQLLAREESRRVLRFAVHDTGPGIPTGSSEQLFQPFSQLDTSTARRFGGTGLGLAICRKLAELMGGEVGVRSEYGEGATFYFSAPFDTPALTTTPLPDALPDVRVLLVTDRDVVRQTLVRQCERMQVTVRTVHDAAGALSALREDMPTHVIIDAAQGKAAARDVAQDLRDHHPRSTMMFAVLEQTPGLLWRDTAPGSPVACLLGVPLREKTLMRFLSGNFERRVELRSASTSTQPESFAGLRVLIVEDNIVNQKITSLFLNKANIHPDIAGDGAEALAMVEKTEYDLIFMDMQMPVMDGLEATRQIRGSRTDGRPRIVGLTANVLPEQLAACRAAGMDDVITKPVKIEQLLGALPKPPDVISLQEEQQPTD
jgi:CheY-like chemotaxis protein